MHKNFFSENLRGLIKRANLSYAQLGEAVGVTKQAISDYCNDKATPKSNVLLKLADYFGVSPEYLLNGVEPQDKREHQELNLSGMAIKNLKDCKPELLDFINAMLADSDFYTAVDDFRTQLKAVGQHSISEINKLSDINNARQYMQFQDTMATLDGSLSMNTQKLAGYFKDLAIRELDIKSAEKLIKTKLAELHAAPSDAQP